MYIFKTSGKTFDSVIKNQKHAFSSMPSNWFSGEVVLVSKNKKSCKRGEKQIQFVMKIKDIRLTSNNEIDKYWPNNHDRWKYIVDCYDTIKLQVPFDLEDIIDYEAAEYKPVMTFKKVDGKHESKIEKFIKELHAI